MHYAHLKIT